MKIAAVTLYHPTQKKQADIFSAYYKKFVDTYAMEADFTLLPAHEWRNKIMAMYPDYDYYLTLDSDEIIISDDMRHIMSFIEGHKPKCVLVPIHDYLSASEIAPVRSHKPVIVLRKGETFNDDRCTNAEKMACKITLHHLGYLFNLPWKKDFYGLHNKLEKKKLLSIIEGVRTEVDTPLDVREVICQLSQ